MRRLSILFGTFMAAAILIVSGQQRQAPFSVVEASIPEMQNAMREGRVTSRGLVVEYLARIGMYENRLHAAITINTNAIKDAEELDRERAQGRIRGPLHGIPVAIKDNIMTTGIRTTGGALAFENLMPPYDATLVRNLREAGAVIIAKTGLTELAGYIASGPTAGNPLMPGNYNAVGGYGMNPYDPRKDPEHRTFKRGTANIGAPFRGSLEVV